MSLRVVYASVRLTHRAFSGVMTCTQSAVCRTPDSVECGEILVRGHFTWCGVRTGSSASNWLGKKGRPIRKRCGRGFACAIPLSFSFSPFNHDSHPTRPRPRSPPIVVVVVAVVAPSLTIARHHQPPLCAHNTCFALLSVSFLSLIPHSSPFISIPLFVSVHFHPNTHQHSTPLFPHVL